MYLYTHTCTLMHKHAHMHTFIHMHTHMHTHAHTCTHMHTHAHSCTHMHTYAHSYTHVHSCTYRYLDFIKDTVYRSLPQAKLGGRPGTYQLVKSFLNIRQIGRNRAQEDGLVDGQPMWAMVFYCLRCGDMEDALDAVTKAG